VLVLAFIGRRLGFQTVLPWVLLLLVAAKFLLLDMLLMRTASSQSPAPVTVFFNFQILTGVLLLAGFFCLSRLSQLPATTSVAENVDMRLLGATGEKSQPMHGGIMEAVQLFRILANSVALLIVLEAGTLEIDRAFPTFLAADFSDPPLAEQVAISIFWPPFAIVPVVVGFRFWSAGLPLFVLSLFGVTVIKVLLIDLGEVRFGYRILSLLGLGLLLLATSVLYGKVGAKMLRQRD